MSRSLFRQREFYASLLVLAIGLAVVGTSATYPVGTLFEMGPGYFPLLVGGIMVAVGVLLLAGAMLGAHAQSPGPRPAAPRLPDPRGLLGIVAAILAFVGLAPLGFIPSAFVCVLLAALGDRGMRLATALALSAVATALGVLLFSYGLQLQLPLFGRLFSVLEP